MQTSTKRVFVKTYGCQMNAYDSERMRESLIPLGYGEAERAEEADLLILNTCHIREKAAEKVYSELGRIARMKRKRSAQGSKMLVAVAGCVAQAEGEEMLRRAPAIDLVFGPQAYHRLPQLLDRHLASGEAVVEAEFAAEEKFAQLGKRTTGLRPVTAFLTVQEGCDKFCTFCVVPYTRGSEFSRPVLEIENEARALAGAGVREVTLLGQNVNAYRGLDAGGDTVGLAGLIARLSQISGIERLRYTTSHPRDMREDLIAAHERNPKLMPYLHLPVQSGSNRMLKAMNRGHTADEYVRLIERVRKAKPDIAISGDFIVGFPGETEGDFSRTLDLVREVRYAAAYSFKYSARPGTPAAEAENQIHEPTKLERLHRLQALLHRQQSEFNSACINRKLPILLDKPGRKPGQLIGRSPYLQAVHIDGAKLTVGQIVEAHIDSVGTNTLSGHYEKAA
jgi:tRNA-2-methylthio-N6-dimethylallyladenosine synthase